MTGPWAGNEMEGGVNVFLQKKWTFPPQNETKLNQTAFLFYILLIWGVRTHPTHSPAYGHTIG